MSSLADVQDREPDFAAAVKGPAAARPEPRLTIETLEMALPRQDHSRTLTTSIVLHVIVLGAIVVLPLIGAADLPEATTAASAFFVEPVTVAPPPPPPPPPSPKAATLEKAPPRVEPASTFTAPVETPPSVLPEASFDSGLEGGVPGGVEGGVEGGVVGGVVGGLADEPHSPVVPVRVGGAVREPKKIKDVAPEYPLLARQARMHGVVIIEARIGTSGRVEEARILRGVPLLDEAALKAVRQWVYTPTLLGGVPVPIIMTITVNFSLRPGPP
jgi:protein TonB